MKLHIYHHICPCDDDTDVIKLLKLILAILQNEGEDAKLRQEIMDKLIKLEKDIEGTIP
jgi:hypothetical protein